MKTLNYVDLSDLPDADVIYDKLNEDLNIDLSPSHPTLLDNTDLDDYRYNPEFTHLFETIDELKKMVPDFKIMVHG